MVAIISGVRLIEDLNPLISQPSTSGNSEVQRLELVPPAVLDLPSFRDPSTQWQRPCSHCNMRSNRSLFSSNGQLLRLLSCFLWRRRQQIHTVNANGAEIPVLKQIKESFVSCSSPTPAARELSPDSSEKIPRQSTSSLSIWRFVSWKILFEDSPSLTNTITEKV